MAKLFGQTLDAKALAERAGSLTQFGGVRLVTLADGAERGIRALEFRSGTGLQFTVLVDRAMDIADLSHNGRAIGWHSPTGFRSPALHEPEGEDGLSWTRSFSGFLSTCGLDHILGPEQVSGDNYNYPRKAMVSHGLHGRIGAIPARLTGYGETWDGERCVLWAEGVIAQAAVFGEVLHLHRRIEVDLGGSEIRLNDRVENAGFVTTPHMFFYHINLGFPLIDKDTRLAAPIKEVVWASHEADGLEAQGVGYDKCPDPIRGFTEQVWEHEMVADENGRVPVAVLNDQLGLGLQIETSKDQFPCSYQWQNFQSGHYVMAVEPSTHHVKGNLFARERDEMIWLEAGETRSYQTTFRVLEGASEMAAARDRIAAIAEQPTSPYPQPTGAFAPLHGAAGEDK